MSLTKCFPVNALASYHHYKWLLLLSLKQFEYPDRRSHNNVFKWSAQHIWRYFLISFGASSKQVSALLWCASDYIMRVICKELFIWFHLTGKLLSCFWVSEIGGYCPSYLKYGFQKVPNDPFFRDNLKLYTITTDLTSIYMAIFSMWSFASFLKYFTYYGS